MVRSQPSHCVEGDSVHADVESPSAEQQLHLMRALLSSGIKWNVWWQDGALPCNLYEVFKITDCGCLNVKLVLHCRLERLFTA
jgi:hypothetical protein